MRILFLLLTLLPATAMADLLAPADGSGNAALYLDNDVVHGQDRDYTSGIRFAWISDTLAPAEQGWLEAAFAVTALGLAEPALQHQYGFSLNQLIYTPDDAASLTQPAGQRRYAGWLGLGFSLHAKSEKVLNSVEFALGTTGPNSFAEDTQRLIHEVGENKDFRGWDSQVPNEITFDISLAQKRRAEPEGLKFGAFSVDALAEWGARLGTFRTSAHLGGMIRGGLNLTPDFSDTRLSDTAYSHRSDERGEGKAADWSPYILLGATLRGVAHDATLDGPVFRNFETGNRREPFVADFFTGLGIRYRSLELSYVHSWRSEEYTEQQGGSEIGSVALSMRF